MALFLRAAQLLSVILIVLTVAGMALALLLPDHVPGTSYAWLGELPAAVRDLTVRLLPYVLLVCLTEKRTPDDIDRLVEVLAEVAP